MRDLLGINPVGVRLDGHLCRSVLGDSVASSDVVLSSTRILVWLSTASNKTSNLQSVHIVAWSIVLHSEKSGFPRFYCDLLRSFLAKDLASCVLKALRPLV